MNFIFAVLFLKIFQIYTLVLFCFNIAPVWFTKTWHNVQKVELPIRGTLFESVCLISFFIAILVELLSHSLIPWHTANGFLEIKILADEFFN